MGDLLLINKYTNFGVSLDYLLNRYKIKRSTFYFKSRLFFTVNRYSRKNKYFKGYSLNTKGEKVYDEYIKKLLVDLLSIDDPSNPEFFYKTLGSKKLAVVFKQKYGIIINHKKIHRLRKELNLTRNYHRHSKHPKKRPKNH
ncbi:integrase, partial [Marinitoga sp. 1154]|nr:integrase [Marinitoga sp. 1154]